jgi:hypothetical protein
VLAVTYQGDLVRFNEADGTLTTIGHTGFSNLNALTRDGSGRLYAASADGNLIRIDPESGRGDSVGTLRLPSSSHVVRAIAASADGQIYFAHGSLYELSDDTLARFDLRTRSTTDVNVLRVAGEAPVYTLTGLSFATDGRLIGWDQALFGLISIDVATAAVTRIGPRGSPGANIETLAHAEDGGLHGIGGYARGGQDNYFDFDARGVPTSHRRVGPLDVRGMEFEIDGGSGGNGVPPPGVVVPPEDAPPRREVFDNL